MDVSARDQNFRRKAHRFREIMSDRSQRRQKKIAKAVTLEAGAFLEAMAKKLREQSLILAERDDTVADVARRKHVEFLAQASAGASVVADRDHSAKVANEGRIGLGGGHLRRGEREALESLEQRGEARASADGDHAEATLARGLLHRQQIGGFSFHPKIGLSENQSKKVRLPGSSFPATPGRQPGPGTTAR